MKKTRTQRAITLIALIITIVILLIIAVVAIGAVRNSKMIAHAQNAAIGYNDEKGREEGILLGAEALLDKYAGVTITDDNVPVPAGFKVVTGTKDTGLVIEHETEGSQFVWVPVTTPLDPNGYGVGTADYREPDLISVTDSYGELTGDGLASNLTRAGCVDKDEDGALEAEDFKVQLTEEYQEMVESVNKNKGFYIGRYEVSINGNRAQSKGSTEANPVYSALASKVSLNDNNATDWYGLYALCKSYNTGSVKSTMMWGVLFDELEKWLGSEATNFNLENRNKDNDSRTGLVSTDVVKNIYDLCGCTTEFTLEAFGMQRVRRGGDSYTGWAPCLITNSIGSTGGGNRNYGSRMAIFIKESSDSTEIENGIFAENPVFNLGKYVRYDVDGDGTIELDDKSESILWRVLRDDKDKVELITADALGTLDLTPKDFNDARIKYNTGVNLITQKCREVTGISTVRSIGGPDTIDEETETYVFTDIPNFVPVEGADFSQYEATEENPENGFLKGKMYNDDISQMNEADLEVADNEKQYWSAFRYVFVYDSGKMVSLNLGWVPFMGRMCSVYCDGDGELRFLWRK